MKIEHDTPEAIAITDKAARELMEVEGLKAINSELLEALQEMVKQFTKTPSTLSDTNARIKAHAAIVKATGEKS